MMSMFAITLIAAIGLMTSATPWTHLGLLSGAWEHRGTDSTYQETWLPAVGESMQGTAREVRDGKVVFMEFFSVEVYEKTVTLNLLLGSPTKGPKTPKHFKLTSSSPRHVQFEDPANDFPHTIRYESDGPDTLKVSLIGAKAREDMTFRRIRER
jgi:hypothetical protein